MMMKGQTKQLLIGVHSTIDNKEEGLEMRVQVCSRCLPQLPDVLKPKEKESGNLFE